MKPLRVLIDESLPVELAGELQGHDVSTVRRQGWIGLRNGVLLRAAISAGFEVLITADRSLPYQQNLPKLGIAVVIDAGVRNKIEEVRALVPQILDAIATIKPGEALRVTRRDSVSDRPIAVAAPTYGSAYASPAAITLRSRFLAGAIPILMS